MTSGDQNTRFLWTNFVKLISSAGINAAIAVEALWIPSELLEAALFKNNPLTAIAIAEIAKAPAPTKIWTVSLFPDVHT